MKGEEELELKMCFFVHTVSLRSVILGMCLRKKNISLVHKTRYNRRHNTSKILDLQERYKYKN